MEIVLLILILLAAVVVSDAVIRIIPIGIPIPLIQITIGAVLSTMSFGVTLSPDIFFLLFLPPLLFLDGWRISKEALSRDKWTVLQLALGLVIFTVLGVGLFIYWMIPSMPMAAAFALAAIVSPTDPVAVSAIAKRVPMPKRLMHILEGESLLNDASGLVSMNFAAKAAMGTAFSLSLAFGTFVWTSLAGLAIGAIVTFIVMWVLDRWTRKFGEEPSVQIIISLLIPFIAYLLAERVEASGILAAVAAGITMSFTDNYIGRLATTRMRRLAVWDMMQFVLNGVIFVLLGEQLPQIISSAANVALETGHFDPLWLILYVVAINFALAVLRFVWVWVSLRFTLSRASRKGIKQFVPGWRLVAVISLSGVRGTVTLAGVLTLVPDFPLRGLIIFLSAGVILLSLIAASIALPYLLKDIELPPEPSHQREEDRARSVAAEAAIRAVEQAVHDRGEGRADADIYTAAAARVMENYRAQLTGEGGSDEDFVLAHKTAEIERELHLEALRAERKIYVAYGRRHQLSEETLKKLIRETDLLETRFTND